MRPRGSPSTAISIKHTGFAIVRHSGRLPEDADVLLVYMGAALTQLGNCLSWYGESSEIVVPRCDTP
jgi:hypothetical protein